MSSQRKSVAAVIVTFNRLEKLKDTLARTLQEPFDAVVVVNNASTDGTGEWLDAQAELRLHVIHSTENGGGAGGFHQGFKYAAEKLPGTQWLCAFDDDAYPEPGTLEKFDVLEIPDDVGSVAAAVYLPDGRISEMNRPSVNPFWHLKDFYSTALKGRSGFHVEDEDYQRTEHMEVDSSSFVGYFLRLSLIRDGTIGLPRAELFVYTDDIIYTLEVRKTGVRHWFLPGLKFNHDCQTLVEGVQVLRPLWKVYFMYRNRLEMYRTASGVFFPLVFVVKVLGFGAAVRFYRPHERGTFSKVTALAVWDGMRRNFSRSFEDVRVLSEVSEGR